MGVKRWWMLGMSFGVVFLLDLITKEYVVSRFPLYVSRTVIPGFFRLVHYQNKGVAFGFLGGSAPAWRDGVLLLFPLAAVAGILIYAFSLRPKRSAVVVALGAIVGGALGNLLDRIRYGGVVDFLDFSLSGYHWPAFNVADSAISVGVGYLIFQMVFQKGRYGDRSGA